MAGKRLIFHIGTHKTGSTSLQKCLLRNTAALRKRSVRALREKNLHHPSGDPVPRCNLSGFASLLMRSEVKSIARLKGRQEALSSERRARRLDRLADRVAGHDEETVIMSAEGLCFLRTPEESRALDRFIARTGRVVQTILVLRDEPSWRESWSAQVAKALADEPVSPAEQTGPDGILGDWYFDAAAIRAFWSPFNLSEIAYDPHQNIVPEIFRTAGIDTSGLALDFRINVRKA